MPSGTVAAPGCKSPRGSVQVNGEELEVGDGVALSNETALRVTAKSDTEVLVFDMG